MTSGTFSPSSEQGIGMAYLRADLAEPGTELEIVCVGSVGRPVAQAPLQKAR